MSLIDPRLDQSIVFFVSCVVDVSLVVILWADEYWLVVFSKSMARHLSRIPKFPRKTSQMFVKFRTFVIFRSEGNELDDPWIRQINWRLQELKIDVSREFTIEHGSVSDNSDILVQRREDYFTGIDPRSHIFWIIVEGIDDSHILTHCDWLTRDVLADVISIHLDRLVSSLYQKCLFGLAAQEF